jgi:SAM-dependent methyltransferase
MYSNHISGHLVDLGCGESSLKEYFLQYADSYTGVDWAGTLHNSKADVLSNLNERIDLGNETADTLISMSVIEHLCEPQVFLNESYRILKKNGYMILQVPWQWHIHEAPDDYFRYTIYGLKYMFKKAGFKQVHVEAQTGLFTTSIIKMNYFIARFIRGPIYLRWLLTCAAIPIWTIGQLVAPYLDKIDGNWEAESQSYIVIARKIN